MILASRRTGTPPAEEDLPVLGWVVVIFNADGRVRGLTNSDVMDRETAEHEMQTWRHSKDAAAYGRRYEVRPVLAGES